ncbi:MAG: helix-turn-helix domain-containing protein [Lachnospiraceae bacterium]|nr:helix-turn-helix domain-containing protein [Lachnospiraceae bacterium]
MRDLRVFCSMFYASHYLPIALYCRSDFICSAGFHGDSDPYPFVMPKLLKMGSPAVYVSSDTGFYGLVKYDADNCFVLGPAYSTPITEEGIRAYINKNAISPGLQGDIAQFLGGIPQYTYNQFLNLLVYLHYILTGEQLSVTEAFSITDTGYQQVIGQQHTEKAYQDRENQRQHGTYNFERQMLSLIERGDTEQLNQFLMESLLAAPIQEGKLADTPLRQAKNLLIGTAAMVGKEAAIPGGMDIEQAYQLIDVYTQECERLQSVEAVKNLQYNMLMDFTNRVAKQRLPAGISKEVHTCIQYISTHINEPISAIDVVAFSGKSRACLFKKFRQELGMTIGAYITACKIREAKFLLQYTDKSLGEISNYLCFSSQSYFQNVFKKHCGFTPLEYRKAYA